MPSQTPIARCTSLDLEAELTPTSPALVLEGNVETCAETIPRGACQMIATSPPYWALRNYKDHPDQIGHERTPELYVERIRGVFASLRHCLRDDGTLWLNLGDSYLGSRKGGGGNSTGRRSEKSKGTQETRSETLAGKQLAGIPWRVALALQADGWILRSEIIWRKPNVMPESAYDRPGRDHETIFLFSKSQDYYYDWFGVRQKGEEETGRNLRTVWDIATASHKLAHFAIWPVKLVERMLQSGTSDRGNCVACGLPTVRKVGRERVPTRPGTTTKIEDESEGTYGNRDPLRHVTKYTDLGFAPQCSCGYGTAPAVVLDPFAGSGSTLAQAVAMGRYAIGIELVHDYAKLCRQRVGEVMTKQGREHTATRILPVPQSE